MGLRFCVTKSQHISSFHPSAILPLPRNFKAFLNFTLYILTIDIYVYILCMEPASISVNDLEITLRQIDAFHGFWGYLITNGFEKNVPIGIEYEYDIGECNFVEGNSIQMGIHVFHFRFYYIDVCFHVVLLIYIFIYVSSISAITWFVCIPYINDPPPICFGNSYISERGAFRPYRLSICTLV